MFYSVDSIFDTRLPLFQSRNQFSKNVISPNKYEPNEVFAHIHLVNRVSLAKSNMLSHLKDYCELLEVSRVVLSIFHPNWILDLIELLLLVAAYCKA